MRKIAIAFACLIALASCQPAFATDDADKFHVGEVAEITGLVCVSPDATKATLAKAVERKAQGVPFRDFVQEAMSLGCLPVQGTPMRFEGVADPTRLPCFDGSECIVVKLSAGDGVEVYTFLPPDMVSDKPPPKPGIGA